KRVKKNFTPRPVAHRPYRPSQRPVRTNMNDARPNRTFFNKQVQSYANRPVHKTSAVRSPYRAPWVSTVNRDYPPVNRKFSTGSRNFPTANRKFPTASRKSPTGSTKSLTADMGMKGKAIKPSACCSWKPSQNLSNKGPKNNSGSSQNKIDDKGYWDSGCSRHMTECIVLGRDFKLLDDANILLRTPRQHNMYSIDLNNIVPRGDLTCLVAKASADECMLWHRRLGKFEEKGDEGYFIGYSMSSKAFMVFNKRTRRVEENLHVEFLENKAIEKGSGPYWLFDIDSLTKSMNYVPVDAGTISTNFSGTKDAARQEVKKDVSSLRYIALPNWAHDALLEFSSSKPQDHCSTKVPEGSRNPNPIASTPNPPADHIETLIVETPIPTVSSPVPTAFSTDSQEPSSDARLISKRVTNQEETPSLDNILSLTNRFEDILRGTTNSDESNGEEADITNMETAITASPTPTLRIHKDHPKIEPKKISDALQDPSWEEAMQEELLQFKIQNVWTLVGCPKWVRPIETKWVLKNKKDERGIVIRNEARLVAQRHTQEEGIDYDEVFAPVARIEAIRLFLAYASFMGFIVYQMDVKSAFLYGTINEEVKQREDFILVKVYVDDIIFGSSNPQLCREFKALMHEKFQMSAMGDLFKKFGYSDVRSSNTPMNKENPWGKDETGKDVDLHLYRSMIVSLMYLTASRPDIMFAVCACAMHQVTPTECHLHAVKRIFRYLEGHPKLGLWYPKESPFDLVAYSDSNYGGATQDHKSTTRGCQFLGKRLISWQCKKQTIMTTSITEAEYVAAASCCGQVLWIQNQLLDYGEVPVEHAMRGFVKGHIIIYTLFGEHNVDFHPMVDFIEASPLRIETMEEGTKILATVDGIVRTVSESSLRDVSQGEACPTDSGFITDQDRATIAKSSTLLHDTAPRVTSPAAVEGSMQQTSHELTALCTSLQRVKLLEEREGVTAKSSRDDAPIKGKRLDEEDVPTERVSSDTEEIRLDEGEVVPTAAAVAPANKTSEEVPEEVKSSDEVPEEKIKELIQLVPIEEVYVEALQVKHPIIDWKVHTEGQRSYWKITRLGGSSASYQFFVDMLKQIDREDLNQLWALVKETLSIRPATDEKEMELWVELKRLYEPDVEDHLWTRT
nr:hypothetical protein [Tanacetum cinerariifolium]